MKSYKPPKKLKKRISLGRHWIVFSILCVLAYAFFIHTDILEISSHSYIFLDSIFKGRFFSYYQYVAEHPFGKELYYLNNANYNITTYAVFGIFQLPIYIFNAIFGTFNETLLYYVAKFVGVAFFFACISVVRKIALLLKLDSKTANYAALFFALSPVAFFSPLMMSQYDSLPLFLALLGILYWMRGDVAKCVLWMGLGAACKFYVLLLLVPLVLLREKRVLRIIKYGVMSLWLIIPTTLLFLGRIPDANNFNSIMVGRLLEVKFSAASNIPVFLTLYLILCAAAFLWTPKKDHTERVGMWLCLMVTCLFALLVLWHPQWLILLVPFVVLTTMLEKNRIVWWWLDIMFAAGFFLVSFMSFPVDGNLFDFGVLGLATGFRSGLIDYVTVAPFLAQIPMFPALSAILLSVPLICNMFLKFPLESGSLATRLSTSTKLVSEKQHKLYAWFIFVAGMLIWFVPSLIAWLVNFVF